MKRGTVFRGEGIAGGLKQDFLQKAQELNLTPPEAEMIRENFISFDSNKIGQIERFKINFLLKGRYTDYKDIFL